MSVSRPRIGTVALLVRDYDEAKAWFTTMLGFAVVDDRPMGDGKRWVVVAPPGAETRLLLARAATPEQGARVGDQTGGRVFLFLETDDFERDFRAMAARGVKFREAPRREEYGTVAVFEDLYGNLWDLIEPSDAREQGRKGATAPRGFLPREAGEGDRRRRWRGRRQGATASMFVSGDAPPPPPTAVTPPPLRGGEIPLAVCNCFVRACAAGGHDGQCRSPSPGAALTESPNPFSPEETCPKCLKARSLCVCDEIVPIANRVALLVLQHPQEQDKTLGTARVAVQSLENAVFKVGLSWPSLAKALGRPAEPRNWAVVYLGSTRPADFPRGREIAVFDKKGTPVADQDAALAAIEGVVVLDGTWSQAKTLWWRNPWVLKAKRIALKPSQPSLYGRLRREPRREGLSTLESAALVLSRLENRPEIEKTLLSTFRRMLQRYRSALATPPAPSSTEVES